VFSISGERIDQNQLSHSLSDERAGALVVFAGLVRDHNQGKKVTSLEYQVYLELAQKEGEKIIQEALQKFNLHGLECVHRFGHLAIGDIAVWVGATASHRDDAFKATRFVIDEIKHRLPIWKKEHYFDESPEWVSCRDHHHHVHFQEQDYYKKQAKIVDQATLKTSRVLVVGAGGLGCPALTSLAVAGVGHIDLVDFDKVDISNLHRQTLFSPALVGEKKAIIAKIKLMELNPFIEVRGMDRHVNVGNVEELILGRDLVLDCTDNMRTKFLLHDACFKLRIPLISASIFQDQGQVRTFVPSSDLGCLRCTYQETPDDVLLGNCNDFGVLGAAVAVIGHIQASEAIRFLQTGSNSTLNETFYCDLNTLSQMKIKNIKRQDCLCCAGQVRLETDDFEIDAGDLNSDFAVVDIRETSEDDLPHLANSGKKIAVLCQRGVRSYRAVKALRAQGQDQFYSIRGGACSL
jgi:molybdopterin/thiamine biosynthesis adenylyltransferase/molybdopterin synthase catalytic subunit